MSKLTLGSHPFLLGFEQLERLVERTAKSGNEGYPPFNIEQSGEFSYRITLAVAGFAEADLSITVEDRQLVIRGRQTEDDDRVFLHRGIAARQFQRSFVLADGVEVSGASLENGLHSSYPGHGGIPRGLDPREQPWYRNAVEMRNHATSWSEAYVDPETRQVVFAATMPLKRPNGEIAGVTALILPVSDLFEGKLLLRNIPPETRYFMISSETEPKTGR